MPSPVRAQRRTVQVRNSPALPSPRRASRAGRTDGSEFNRRGAGQDCLRRQLEPIPFRLNRNGALDSCFDAVSSREPVSTSLENALVTDE
ncbi:hypothetical protein CWS35_12840 [Bradyrhizobium sp. SK17]|nr:hypothetical protein CWS35_12840 [Bradyrhizobium sp. SK17]